MLQSRSVNGKVAARVKLQAPAAHVPLQDRSRMCFLPGKGTGSGALLPSQAGQPAQCAYLYLNVRKGKGRLGWGRCQGFMLSTYHWLVQGTARAAVGWSGNRTAVHHPEWSCSKS